MKTFVDIAEEESEAEESDFKPLTAEEADQWRKRYAPLSMGLIVGGQVLVGLLVVLLVWLGVGRAEVVWSAAYGVLAVVVPAGLFARGLSPKRLSAGSGNAMAKFVVWEFGKVFLTVAMLVAAPRLVSGLNWLALLASMVITMKTYWVALLVKPGFLKLIHKEKS
ncbi:MAG: ATP synthase subunit I [Burkholderiaceae bacterium]|nr:ATP synthase subunit I [Burkholderiaceae bacterium]